MTELERKALLGDREAQKQLTKSGILLPCPFCGGNAKRKIKITTDKKLITGDVYVNCEHCGFEYNPVIPVYSIEIALKVIVDMWNTRPAPPIGWCGECKHSSYYEEYGNRWCNLNLGSRIVRENDYCNHFEPKECEENAVD